MCEILLVLGLFGVSDGLDQVLGLLIVFILILGLGLYLIPGLELIEVLEVFSFMKMILRNCVPVDRIYVHTKAARIWSEKMSKSANSGGYYWSLYMNSRIRQSKLINLPICEHWN